MKNKQKTEKLSRKEALKKGGKYAALTAATMMMILGPSNNAAAQSNAPEAPDRWSR
jgi:hypothetical protein